MVTLITLLVPPSTQRTYGIFGGFIVGPIMNGLEHDEISYRYPWDSLWQSAGMFRENNVEHAKMEARLYCVPAASDAIPAYTWDYPKRVKWESVYGSTNTPNISYYDGGFAPSSGYYRAYGVHYGVVVNGSTVRYYELRSNGAYIDWVRVYVYGNVKSSGNFVTHDSELFYYVYRPPTVNPVWNEDQNIGLLSDVCDSIISKASPVSQQLTTIAGRAQKSTPVANLADLRGAVDAAIADVFSKGPKDLPEYFDFGNLAMDAVKKMDANKVNMFAFLRDLRHPTELIPKLKNLSKLKGAADNYLTVNYGILPTISDLRAILGAFQAARPYLDRFGWRVWNADGRSSLNDGKFLVENEQHIKVVVASEDNEFLQLLEKVSDMGFALTLENVWDLIPYSFALDWFVNIGGLLERVDTRLRILRLDIRYVTQSRKLSVIREIESSPSLPVQGLVQQVHYSRWTTDRCPVPPLSAKSTTTPIAHWLEAGALIIQRKKK